MSVEPTAIQPALEGRNGAERAPALRRARERDLSTAVWLTAIIGVSALVRFGFGMTVPGPGIFPDENVYAEFSRSLGESGAFLIRDVPFAVGSYGPLYVLLLAPVYLIEPLSQAYLVAKAVGALVASLSAVPAYFLARRLLERREALLAAALTLLLPSIAYSSRLMTENLFLPIFLTAVLASVMCLERPTRVRQLSVLAVFALALLTRAQAVALVPAFVTAATLLSHLELRSEGMRGLRPLGRRLIRYRTVWFGFGAAAATGCVLAVVRGGSPVPLGRLHDGVLSGLDVLDLPKWILYHTAQLDLAVGVIPFVAFLLLARVQLKHPASAPNRAFWLVSLSMTGWLLLTVGLYATHTPYPRINERYLFYLEPLFLIAFVAWLKPPRPTWTPLVLVAAMLPLVLPYGSLLNAHVFSQTPGLIAWLVIRQPGGLVAVFVGVAALCIGAALVLIRGRKTEHIVLPVVIYLVVSALLAQAAFTAVSHRAVESVGASPDRAWIDHAVGERAEVTAVWRYGGEWWWPRRQIFVNEFFNRSLGRVYYLYDPETYDLPQTRAHVRGSAVVVDGRPLRAEYVLSNGAPIAGQRIAERREAGLVLYRVDGLVRVVERRR